MTQRLQQLADGWSGSEAQISLGPDAQADLRALGVDVKPDSEGVCRATFAVINGALHGRPQEPVQVAKQPGQSGKRRRGKRNPPAPSGSTEMR